MNSSQHLLLRASRTPRTLCLIVVGDVNIGKTSLSKRFVSGIFSHVRIPTKNVDFFVRNIEVGNGRDIEVRIWDTAGTEKHRALAPLNFRGVHGCMLVYDCTNASTFDNIPEWAKILTSYTRVPVPSVLVANKTDLGEVRAVLPDEGAALARELGACRFFETSAKDGSNVDAAFFALLDAILKTRNDENPSKPPKDVQSPSEAADNATSCVCAI